MDPAEGARTFRTSGDAYDRFMGRYSRPLARLFADAAGIAAGQTVLDVGCGPGALTTELVERLGVDAVAAVDPSPDFLAACIERHPGVDVQSGRAEEIPFETARFDAALAQLVVHFVTDAPAAIREMARVVHPGGVVAACIWDSEGGMEMLRQFWEAAVAVDPAAPEEVRVVRFGGAGELTALFEEADLVEVEESVLPVGTTYQGFDELWSGFLEGVGPAGAYLVGLPDDHQAAIHDALFQRVGSPAGGFGLSGTARCAVGRTPTA